MVEVMEFWVEATIKVKYLCKVIGEYDAPTVEHLEASEIEVMLDKDLADVLYTDNQVARFDEVEVTEIKATLKEMI
jgi:hypothetical protein